MNVPHQLLIEELKRFLKGGGAHVGILEVLKDMPVALIAEKPHGLPYSIWQLTEHIRLAQWDMLEFSKDANHQSPEWPEGYWPDTAGPENEDEWYRTVNQIESDLNEFIRLMESGDLFTPFPHGDGQQLLREALQIADHNAYHTAEIVVIRRLLGAWKK